MVYYLKPVRISPTINLGYNVPKEILDSKLSLRAHDMLFGGMTEYSLAQKIQLAGRCMKDIFANKVNDRAIDIVKYYINRLMKNDSKSEDIPHLVNVFYSTAIKKIYSEDILSGRVSPGVYKNLVEESIKNYRENPIDGKIDYRHIAGRMITLKTTCQKIVDKVGFLPKRLSELKWDEDMQLDYITVLEKILNDYDNVSKNFNASNGYRYEFAKRAQYTYDMHKSRYFQNIKDLLHLTYIRVIELMKNPSKNKNIIEDKLDIAYQYFDKIPYSHPEMPALTPYIMRLTRQEKCLTKLLKKQKN